MPRQFIEFLTEEQKESQGAFRRDARKKLANKNLTKDEQIELLVDYVVGGLRDA